MQILFQHVHGHINRLDCSSLFLGLGQGSLVYLLVLVQGDGVNLHGNGRHHVGRFLVHDEAVQRLDIHLLVAHDIGRNELAAAFLVKGLYRSILDARELADDALDFLQLDAESAYLDLTVTASHKLDVTRGQETNDVARAIDAGIFFLGGERIGDIDFGCLLGAIQVATTHLRTCCPQFTRCSHGKTMALWVNDVQAHVFRCFADRNILHLLIDKIVGNEYRRLGGAIYVVELETLGWC